jgi:sec-independent protein translocase protein TatC
VHRFNGNKWSSPDHDPENFRLSLIEHLEELRKRIVRCLWILCIAWGVSWLKVDEMREFLTNRAIKAMELVAPKGSVNEVVHQASEFFMIKMRISFFCAFLIAFPFIVLQIWAFIAPGLKPNEQKPFKRLAPFSLVLFVIGALFSWLVMPSAFQWFVSYMPDFPGVKLNQEAGSLAMFTLKCLLAFGIGFQLPLLVYILGALNLLSAETLVKYWRHAAVAIFFLAGAITPSNDPATMLMMAVPLTVLFMISAWAVKVTQKNRKKDDFLWSPDEESKKIPEPKNEEFSYVAPIDYYAETTSAERNDEPK